ncbi:5-oxoprolinase subunit PxpA [Thiomicrospira sp. WB1]|uniref:5-oxoprolinase subunit PxpA n=1 Tax=Thiomicrospira sp. WB1 TaxID=1685380 RepID=UPI00074731DF|nr:5-oxoprolinase subunit PxpA [Thiomicrospira sp. WB1]KUJ72000.1 hypothetical protein AVO41_06015 [Thiomicrospira sp. WB1]
MTVKPQNTRQAPDDGSKQMPHTPSKRLLKNCDLGEQPDTHIDAAVMPHIDQANIACGGHAGDAQSMKRVLQLAKTHNVAIGAHPSYPDRANFGRQSLNLPWAELEASLTDQVRQLTQIAASQGLPLQHIKPHGALYLDMMRSETLFARLLDWADHRFPGVPLMAQWLPDTAAFHDLAQARDLPIIWEAFADRRYQPNGQLAPRHEPDCLHTDAQGIIDQAWLFFEQTQDPHHPMQAHSLCFHSDNPASVEALIALGQTA